MKIKNIAIPIVISVFLSDGSARIYPYGYSLGC